MAKIVITITDQPNDRVSAVSDPSFETMAMMSASGHPLTSAHGYALRAIRAIQDESRRQGPTKIVIPKIGRA